MKPIRTEKTTTVFKLDGGTEENDLPVEMCEDLSAYPVMVSVWEPDEAEREKIREMLDKGELKFQLAVWGNRHPPVSLKAGEELE